MVESQLLKPTAADCKGYIIHKLWHKITSIRNCIVSVCLEQMDSILIGHKQSMRGKVFLVKVLHVFKSTRGLGHQTWICHVIRYFWKPSLISRVPYLAQLGCLVNSISRESVGQRKEPGNQYLGKPWFDCIIFAALDPLHKINKWIMSWWAPRNHFHFLMWLKENSKSHFRVFLTIQINSSTS